MIKYCFINGFKIEIQNSKITIKVEKMIAEAYLSGCALAYAAETDNYFRYDQKTAALVVYEVKKIQKSFEHFFPPDIKKYIAINFPVYAQRMGLY